MMHIGPSTFKRAIISAICLAVATLAQPAQALVYADYFNVYQFNSTVRGQGGMIFAAPSASPNLGDATISGPYGYEPGDNILSHWPVFFNDLPGDTPTDTTMIMLSTLDNAVSITDLSDLADLHLVLALDQGFASSIVGMSFEDAFAGFANFADSYAGGTHAGFTEMTFITELVYANDLEALFGLPNSDIYGPQTNLLFDFGLYLNGLGAALSNGESLSLVAFSEAQIVGTGTLSIEPSGYTPPPVPEPQIWAMMILGFGLIGARMRRPAQLRFARAA